MSLGSPSVLRGAHSVYRTTHAPQSDLKRRFFTCFTDTQKRLIATDTLKKARPATLEPVRHLEIDSSERFEASRPSPVRQIDIDSQAEPISFDQHVRPDPGLDTIERSGPSKTSYRSKRSAVSQSKDGAVNEAVKKSGMAARRSGIAEIVPGTKILSLRRLLSDDPRSQAVSGTNALPIRRYFVGDLPKGTGNTRHEEVRSELVSEREDRFSETEQLPERKYRLHLVRPKLSAAAGSSEHEPTASLERMPAPKRHSSASSEFAKDPILHDIPSDWKDWDHVAQVASDHRPQTGDDFSWSEELLNVDPAETFKLELFLDRRLTTFEQAKQIRSIGLMSSPLAEERVQGSQAVIDAIISATITRPSDPSLFPDVSKSIPEYGAMSHRSEYWIEQFGERSYDWRRPLEDLLAMSKPLSTQDVARFTAYAERVRAHRLDGPKIRNRYFDMIRPPLRWTRESLTQHIYDLSNSDLASHSLFRQGRDEFENRVRERILTLLVDDECRPFLTRGALHAAIAFMLDHERLPDATRLYDYMEELGMPPTIEDWNLWFRHIAKKRSLGHFSNLLALLKKRGVGADAYTWAQFFACIDSQLVKKIILEQMRRLKYFDYVPILKLVAPHIIRSDFEEHIQANGKVVDFIKKCDAEFGTNSWESQTSTKAMVEILWRAMKIDEVGWLLKEEIRRNKSGRLLSAELVEQLMVMCYRVGHPEGAILLVHLVEDCWRLRLSDRSLQYLFRIFYKHCLPNACRAMWAILCAQGATVCELRVKLIRRLQITPNEIAEPLKDIQTRFDAYENKIIYGRQFMLDWPRLWKEWLRYGDPRERHNRLNQTGLAVMISDTQLHGTWSFRDRTSVVLQEAFQMDMAWRKRPEVLRGDVKWMLQNAYNVPLYPHEGPAVAYKGKDGWFKRVALPAPSMHTLEAREYSSEEHDMIADAERLARSGDENLDDEEEENSKWSSVIKKYEERNLPSHVYVSR